MPLPTRKAVLSAVSQHILDQATSRESLTELRSLGPKDFDWTESVLETARAVLPPLVESAPQLALDVVRSFNNPAEIYERLQSDVIKRLFSVVSRHDETLAFESKRIWEKCISLAQLSTLVIPKIESQQISSEMQRLLVSDKILGNLVKMNGGSIYPDLIPTSFDYSFLPFQSRNEAIHGPCQRNRKDPRPSNVPNGIEIKTNKDTRIKVDAHGAHPGFHLGLTWGLVDSKIKIHDLWVAYIRVSDYTFSDGTVDVTTKKRSFGHGPFISIIRGQK